MKYVIALLALSTSALAHADGFSVREAICYVDNSPIPMTQNTSGELTANLPDGTIATLRSVDSGFNVTYHNVEVQQGTLKVSNTGKTKNKLLPGDKLKTVYVRTSGEIAGKQFLCDAVIDQK